MCWGMQDCAPGVCDERDRDLPDFSGGCDGDRASQTANYAKRDTFGTFAFCTSCHSHCWLVLFELLAFPHGVLIRTPSSCLPFGRRR